MKKQLLPALFLMLALLSLAMGCSKSDEEFNIKADSYKMRKVGLSVKNGVTGEVVKDIWVKGWNVDTQYYVKGGGDEQSSADSDNPWCFWFGESESGESSGSGSSAGGSSYSLANQGDTLENTYFSRITTRIEHYEPSEFYGPSRFKLGIESPYVINGAGEFIYTYPTFSCNGQIFNSDLEWKDLPIIEMDSTYIFLDILLYPE